MFTSCIIKLDISTAMFVKRSCVISFAFFILLEFNAQKIISPSYSIVTDNLSIFQDKIYLFCGIQIILSKVNFVL